MLGDTGSCESQSRLRFYFTLFQHASKRSVQTATASSVSLSADSGPPSAQVSKASVCCLGVLRAYTAWRSSQDFCGFTRGISSSHSFPCRSLHFPRFPGSHFPGLLAGKVGVSLRVTVSDDVAKFHDTELALGGKKWQKVTLFISLHSRAPFEVPLSRSAGSSQDCMCPSCGRGWWQGCPGAASGLWLS